MADTKITALTALTGADPANDVIPIVDVSDTTMAASGTTKKISVNNILGASGTATLASATITGDLTVATDRLKVVTGSTAIQTGSTTQLQVGTTAWPSGYIGKSGSRSLFGNTGEVIVWNESAAAIGNYSSFYLCAKTGAGATTLGGSMLRGGIENASDYSGFISLWTQTSAGAMTKRYEIDSSGNSVWSVGGSTAMTLNSTGLGVGVTPAGTGGCLQLKSGITFPATQVASSDANTLDDYEEGTFTPGITFGGASVGMTGTFAGRYTKVGRSVTANGLIVLTAKGSSTGTALITGLPFTSTNAAGSYWAASLRLSAITFTDVFQGYVPPNSTVINLEQITNAGSDSVLSNSNFPSGTSVLIFNVTYDV